MSSLVSCHLWCCCSPMYLSREPTLPWPTRTTATQMSPERRSTATICAESTRTCLQQQLVLQLLRELVLWQLRGLLPSPMMLLGQLQLHCVGCHRCCDQRTFVSAKHKKTAPCHCCSCLQTIIGMPSASPSRQGALCT